MTMVQIRPQSRAGHIYADIEEPVGSRISALLQVIEDNRPEWMSDPRRNCAGKPIELFYGTDAGAAICQGCVFVDACLWYALDNSEYGVWGGSSERQRRSIRRKIHHE